MCFAGFLRTAPELSPKNLGALLSFDRCVGGGGRDLQLCDDLGREQAGAVSETDDQTLGAACRRRTTAVHLE